MLIKGVKDPKKAEWVPIDHTRKQLQSNDVYVLGDPSVRMPAVVSSSNLKGVKARLVAQKVSKKSGPPTADTKNVEVLKEWSFDNDNQTKPIYFTEPLHIQRPFWIEMLNPLPEDAVVNSLVHGVIRSRNI